MEYGKYNGISIQVSLSGYSFEIYGRDCEPVYTDWHDSGQVFTEPAFQRRYDEIGISLFTRKCALVPRQFFSPMMAGSLLSEVVRLDENDIVEYVEIPEFAAVLLYSNSIGESLSHTLSEMVRKTDGNKVRVYPELYYLLKYLPSIREYNKIVASYHDGYLHLVMAQGKMLLLCNVFEAADFTTAEYFIFLALKKMQLNPEVSTIYFRTGLSEEESMSLYRYFRSVEGR